MELELRPLHYVAEISRQGSVSRAARQLGITQPALSRALQSLEESIGARIFDRLPNGVRLTKIGALLVRRGEEILRRMQDLENELTVRSGLGAGVLSLGAGSLLSRLLIAPAVSELVGLHSRLGLRILVESVPRLRDALRREEIELYVGGHQDGDASPDLAIMPLRPRRLVAFVRRAHPLAEQGQPIRREVALRYPILAPGGTGRTIQLGDEHARAREGRIQLIECEDVALMRILAERNDAIGVEPEEGIGPEIASGRFVRIDTDLSLAELRPCIVWLRDRGPSPAGEALVALLLALDATGAEPGRVAV